MTGYEMVHKASTIRQKINRKEELNEAERFFLLGLLEMFSKSVNLMELDMPKFEDKK